MTNTQLIPIKRALFSLFDKINAVPLAEALQQYAVEIISTGGTKTMLEEHNIAVKDIESITNFPELFDGRVKTLHPNIHGGILADRNKPHHLKDMEAHNITSIDLVVVNLYDFTANPSIEMIDIGGPTMLRGAAKNYHSVCVLPSPHFYERCMQLLHEHQGALPLSFREEMARETFSLVADYDIEISNWFQKQAPLMANAKHFSFKKRQTLRYGENPHQEASLYEYHSQSGDLLSAKQLQGKELSYNNLLDADCAWRLIQEFDTTQPAIAIIKHNTPCGVGQDADVLQAYDKALQADPKSAFGGIVAINQTITAELATKFIDTFYEVIIAPGIMLEAEAILATKTNLRVLITHNIPQVSTPQYELRSLQGGLLIQTQDHPYSDETNWEVVTKKQPTPQEWQDLRFAWVVAKHVKSNAIITAYHGQTLGIGAGQMSRVDAAEIAAAKTRAKGVPHAVAASDAFFPFPDGVEILIQAGITAIIQPGGSLKDQLSIDVANEANITMVMTHKRHFRH